MASGGQAPVSSAYDVENACFKRYCELMKEYENQYTINQPLEWNNMHEAYKNIVCHEFDEASKNFKEKQINDAKSSLLNRIETENKRLLEICKLKEMNKIMETNLLTAKAAAADNEEALSKLAQVSAEQNEAMRQNQQRIDQLGAEHSLTQQEYVNSSNTLREMQSTFTALEHENQHLVNQQEDLLEKCRKDAEELDELNRKLNESRSFSWPNPIKFVKSKVVDSFGYFNTMFRNVLDNTEQQDKNEGQSSSYVNDPEDFSKSYQGQISTEHNEAKEDDKPNSENKEAENKCKPNYIV